MSNTYKITKKIHELLPKVKAKYGLKFEIENDKIIYYDGITPSKTKDYKIGDISMLGEAPSWFLEKSFLLIQGPQLRQILVGLKEALGEKPWQIKEVGDGFVAEIKENERTFRFEKHTDTFSGNVKRRFILNCQSGNSTFFKRVFREKKELELELKKYLLEKGDQYSAEALCSRWLGGLNPLFDREPETVLQDLVEILEILINK